MRESLSRIQKELRAAVETQRYEEIQRQVLAFCEAAEGHARALPPGDPRVGEIAALTQEVLEWTRTMVQAGRACLILQLRQIPKVKQYVPGPLPMPPTMRLDV
ncbi:MAG TPA: hypothetical protein VKT49_17375 [Bryobacteraceae bacterium]|nr:hypothetical protein [Bryobacteraceae bacterium]